MRRGMLFLLFFGSLLHVLHSTQRSEGSTFKSLDRKEDDSIFDRHKSIANCLC